MFVMVLEVFVLETILQMVYSEKTKQTMLIITPINTLSDT